MKKILLIILYPFWFFLAKTWLGGVIMIPIALAPIPLLIYLIFPSLMMETGEEAESVGIGLGIFTLLCSPFTGAVFMTIGDELETNYDKWGYKTEIETKMI